MTENNNKQYVIVRCRDAGVHCGYLEEINDKHVVLSKARRVWYWDGAASISELAVYGLNPDRAGNSKIAVEVPLHKLRYDDHCEIIEMSEVAAKQMQGMPEWRA